MNKIIPEVAKLHAVTYDTQTEEVFVTFKVIQEEYKSLIFKLSTNDEVEVNIRGDKLDLEVKEV